MSYLPLKTDYEETMEEYNMDLENELKDDYNYYIYKKKLDKMFEETSPYFKSDPLWSIRFDEMLSEMCNTMIRESIDIDDLDKEGDDVADVLYKLEQRLSDPKHEINRKIRGLVLIEAEKELDKIVRDLLVD